ncbi:hypothetical protein D4R52_02615 [bacterium]|nr:MAG: hypothetical protein D4R52_02615 [bacterium]
MKNKIPQNLEVTKGQISKFILKSLAVGAGIFASMSPYGLYCLAKEGKKAYFRVRDFNREAKRLEKRGYVALVKTENGLKVRLLEKGERRKLAMRMENLKFEKGHAWDKKWRLFIFDIPEGDKNKRDLLRRKLKGVGMYNFQRSVFAYPYDCRQDLEFISDYYNITKYTTYIEAENIDLNNELKRHFHLP